MLSNCGVIHFIVGLHGFEGNSVVTTVPLPHEKSKYLYESRRILTILGSEQQIFGRSPAEKQGTA